MATSRAHAASRAGSCLGLVAGAFRNLRADPTTELRGRAALVTGGSRGRGFLLARELVRAGCRVAIAARDPDELAAAVAELRTAGGTAIAVRGDVAERADAATMVRETVCAFGRLDVRRFQRLPARAETAA